MLTQQRLLKPQHLYWGLLACGILIGLSILGLNPSLIMPSTDQPENGTYKRLKAATLLRDEDGPNGLKLTAEAIKHLQIRPVEALPAVAYRPLPPQPATINYDNDWLLSIRPRFPGELVEFTQLDNPPPTANKRSLGYGDKVKSGDVLGILWCKDLGEKKAALVDAIINQALSENLFERQKKAYEEGALSLASFKATEAKLMLDRNAVSTAERTLIIWKLAKDEIDEIKTEAREIFQKKKERNPEREKLWARVEIKVPRFPNMDPKDQFTIVEKNTNLGDMVDPSRELPLFRLADMSKLQIWAHPPEEHLKLMRDRLGKGNLRWDVRIQANPDDAEGLDDLQIVRASNSVDPNDRRPMLMGPLNNSQGKFLVGQFATVTIKIPPPDDVVEIPTEAINSVEGENVVFVQHPTKTDEFYLKRVVVVSTSKLKSLVRSKLTAEDEKLSKSISKLDMEKGKHRLSPLEPHEKVITRGIIELTAALDDLVTAQGQEPEIK